MVVGGSLLIFGGDGFAMVVVGCEFWIYLFFVIL